MVRKLLFDEEDEFQECSDEQHEQVILDICPQEHLVLDDAETEEDHFFSPKGSTNHNHDLR